MEEVKAEKKPRSVRIDDATFNKFKGLCEELGGQQECLNSLLTAYEVSQAKATAPGMETNIDTLIYHLNQIQQSFIGMIDINKTTEDRMREEFKVSLANSENTIYSLNERLNSAEYQNVEYEAILKQERESHVEKLAKAENDKKAIQIELEQERETNNSLRKTITDKENIVATKETLISNLTSQLDKLQELDELKAELENAKASVSERDKTITTLKAESEKAQTTINSLNQTIEDKEKSCKQALELAEQQKETAIEKAKAETKSDYIDKVLELQTENSNLKDRIRELKKALESSKAEQKEKKANENI